VAKLSRSSFEIIAVRLRGAGDASIRCALTPAIDEFATDTRWEYAVASEEKWEWPRSLIGR